MASRAKGPKRKKPRAAPKVRSAAPAQHLGYTTQETLLAHGLLSAPPGSALSLEVFEDVGINLPDQTTQALQSKSALVTNPIADRAISLWKTFHNWLHLLTDGVVELDRTTFILYVSKPVAGALASRFDEAGSIDEAEAAIEMARATMWGPAPGYPKRKNLPAELRKYADAVLEDGRTPMLVTRFHLQFGSGSPITDLEMALKKQFLAASHLEDLSRQIQGWVRREIAVLLEQQRPAVVSRDRFYAEISAFLHKISIQQILHSYARAPTAAEQEAELSRMYVRQLQLIELDEEDVLAAVSDYLRAASDRVSWAQKGLVHESSFDEFNEALQAVWRNHRIGARARYPSIPTHHGQCLYSDCMVHQMPLQGIVTRPEFVRGCFHELADKLTVGWHPDYKALLRYLGDRE